MNNSLDFLMKHPRRMLDHRTATMKTAVPFAVTGAWNLRALRGIAEN